MIVDIVHTENTEGNGGPQADCGVEQGLMNDDRLLITDGVHTENTEENGGPQADCLGERQLENNKYPQMSQMDTDGGPQADGGGEQQLSKIGQQLKGNY